MNWYCGSIEGGPSHRKDKQKCSWIYHIGHKSSTAEVQIKLENDRFVFFSTTCKRALCTLLFSFFNDMTNGRSESVINRGSLGHRNDSLHSLCCTSVLLYSWRNVMWLVWTSSVCAISKAKWLKHFVTFCFNKNRTQDHGSFPLYRQYNTVLNIILQHLNPDTFAKFC